MVLSMTTMYTLHHFVGDCSVVSDWLKSALPRPKRDEACGLRWSGKLGEQITTSEGKQAARGIAIELLATLQAALDDLSNVKRILKLLVLVNSAPHSPEPHVVATGASELFLDIFGGRGAHARSAFGVARIPFGSYVEIEMVVETFRSDNLCEV